MSANPFIKKKGSLHTKERIQKSLLFLGTYTILIFTLYIFWHIAWKGAPILMQYGTDFITRKPETLEVVGFDKGKQLIVDQKSFDTLTTYNPSKENIQDIETFKKEFSFTSFKIKEGSLIGDGYLSDIEKQNDFFADFTLRNKTATTGFTVTKNTILNLKPTTFEKIQQSDSSLSKLESQVIEFEDNTFEVNFTKGEFNVQAKTIELLKESNLIYYLFGNLKDTMDDTPDLKMNLEIPSDQTVTLTPSQHSGLQSDNGDITTSLKAKLVEKYQRNAISLNEGTHTIPFNLLVDIIAENPAAPISHIHNLDKGLIALDMKGTSESLLLPTEAFEILRSENPLLLLDEITPVTKEEDYVRFSFANACMIKLPTSNMSALRIANAGKTDSNNEARLKVLNEHVHPYSAGGISGPIWGTSLLVVACMMIGLFIGVASAVFLGEYSKKGRLISTIRLAMLNLAGVPSIVFGIFGLGLFVSVAPKLTKTPSIESKVAIPIFPSWSSPTLRAQEANKIVVINEEQNKTHVLRAAQQNGLSRYFDGTYYLSIEGWGNSIIAGAFTLAMMVLPIIITSSEESLRAVPKGFREASLALGASKWQSIRTAVLPYATPGILTASVLGITRVAGETAPIMFTAAVAEKSDLPFNGLNGTGMDKFFEFISQSVQAMPYHIYTVAGKIPQSDYNKPMQYGSVLVFMIIVMAFAGLSVFLRIRMRKKYKW